MTEVHRERRGGFTLIEVIVVLVVMLVAVGLVAPALLSPEHDESDSELAGLLREVRGVAASRGETLYLRLGPAGDWFMEGASSLAQGPIAIGTLSDYSGPAATVIVSPVGTCAFDVRSTEAWNVVALDPMTCTIVRS